MALEVSNLTRTFSFTKNGKEISLPDPNPEFSVAEVMKFYSGQYPELTNGFIEGPKVKNDKAVYSMTTKAGKLG
jgi:PRTRC genetic system protein C